MVGPMLPGLGTSSGSQSPSSRLGKVGAHQKICIQERYPTVQTKLVEMLLQCVAVASIHPSRTVLQNIYFRYSLGIF